MSIEVLEGAGAARGGKGALLPSYPPLTHTHKSKPGRRSGQDVEEQAAGRRAGTRLGIFGGAIRGPRPRRRSLLRFLDTLIAAGLGPFGRAHMGEVACRLTIVCGGCSYR